MEKNVHDKKWFVYLNDHHEGPFSVDEIEEKKLQGQILPTTHYVWCDGMKDWTLMDEVPEFRPLQAVAAKIAPPPSQVTRETPSAFLESPTVIERSTMEISVPNEPVAMEAPSIVDMPIEAAQPSKKSSPRFRRALGGIALICFILGVAWGGYRNHAMLDRIPFVSDWLSPIPALEQIDSADVTRLRQVARAPLEQAGPQAALAVSKDRQRATVFVASNLPDGARLELRVEGVQGTLLNQPTLKMTVPMTVAKQFAQSQPLIQEGGRPLPQGDYTLAVWGASLEAPKVLETRSVFLGGLKDSIYIERLKKYHDELRLRAKSELVELGQLALTVSSQARESIQTFDKLQKIKGPKAAKAWNAFHAKWSKLLSSMLLEFKNWTPERLRSERFYSGLFGSAKDAAERLQHIQELQDQFFNPKLAPKMPHASSAENKELNQEIATQREHFAGWMSQLETQIKKAQATVDTPDGIPEAME